MKLLDVLTAPWAIEPTKLLEIQAIYATHLRGEKIDIGAVEKKLGRPLANEPKGYQVQDGVAVLPLEGVMAKRMNMFSQISGGTSTAMAERDLQAAMADPAVHSIVLCIDSPGGTVDGTQTLADAVLASTKPICTLASGSMASAAYWVGSAADAVYITDSTTQVGSIGVVATHTDISKAQENQGVKTTEIFAGQYKRIASTYAPLSKEGRQAMQDQVDYTYGLFVNAVAKHRGVSADVVLKNMADGRIFIGQQAISAGLVDGVSTLDGLIQQLNQGRASGTQRVRASGPLNPCGAGDAQATPPTPSNQGTEMLTAEQVASEHPDIAAAFRAQGATAERERIQAVEGQLIPGHEALINTLKFDGKSGAGDAAVAVLAAEKSTRSKQAAALASDAPKVLPIEPLPVSEPKAVAGMRAPAGFVVAEDSAKLDAAAKRYQAEHPSTSYIDAIKAVQTIGG